MNATRFSSRKVLLISLTLLLGGLACTFSLVEWTLPPVGPTPLPAPPTPTPLPVADVTFEVTLPAALLPGETVVVSVLDEVTGLALNAVNYPLEPKEGLTYSAVLPIPVNSVVKYRYLLISSGSQAIEATSANQPVRYRLLHVVGPTAVHDVVSTWTGRPYAGPMGSIQGQILNAETGLPVPDVLVAAGGVQDITDASGLFFLEGLPPGTHNLVAYALDGSFQTFQQGATVAADLITPVPISLQPAQMVNVLFVVTLPKNTVSGAPVRLAGNLFQLGNTFADLRGGLSTIADRMPVLTPAPDGRYTLSISLPAGADIRYKYTLGDGFWNAEHNARGAFVVRQLIVPAQNTVVEDVVETWQAGPSAPILFDVTVPADTPPGDTVYIQFNPYAWMEPIPMWPMGNNRWTYKLYGPLNILGSFGYRYCRNAQCGSADDTATMGPHAGGRLVNTSLTPENIREAVSAWAWLQGGSTSVVGFAVNARGEGFVSGVELQPSFHPTWSPWFPQALQNIQAMGANWTILTPSWTFTRLSPLVLTPQMGDDPLWVDASQTLDRARALNLNVAVFPTPHFPTLTMEEWWRQAPRDPSWWEKWFEQYRAFLRHHADLAAQHGAQALVLGGEWVSPALPGGTVDDTPSGVPEDAEARWREMIADIRKRFNGQIWWALPYTVGSLENAPAFLDDVDAVYLLWYAPVGEASSTKEEMTAEAGRLLDEEIGPFRATVEKPLFLALAVPSARGAATACLPDGEGGCLHWMALSRPNPDIPSIALDLQAQMDVYEAILLAVNERPWVGGVVSRGYYPPALLQDKSASVHGKPAADLLWYWFPRFLGRAP
ncbi:MAG: hypothetical protein D6770_07350 [Anaerolineae bacterium]|nr:MAG: hypothetical protein D6770_07350 [Anaerolineae bacterium]